MTKNTAHAFKIASFNAIGYCMATGVPTYVDPLLFSHKYGARQYPLGYWILLVVPLIFFGNYILSTRVSSWKLKVTLPGLMLLIVGSISLFNFKQPNFPHLNVFGWTFLFALVSIASSWLHYFPMRDNYIHDVSIREAARIERGAR